tara:strand:+ start:286 stop:1227 length:942 start_codon:yes stop_codon:yes gene_type:complete
MVEFFIHPGFVKTGTTFFQSNVIPNIINTLSIGKPYKKNYSLHYYIRKIIYSKKKIIPNAKIKKISDEILEEIKKKKIKRIILSDEAFLDSEFYNPKNNFNNLEKLILHLRKKIKLKIKFILTIRNQTSIIISRFAYVYPKFKKKYSTLEKYIDFNIKKKSFFFQSIKYYDFQRYLQKRFKCEMILLPVEVLENNKKKYLSILKRLFGQDIKYRKIKFFKINKNSKNFNFFLKKGNLWHRYYLYLQNKKTNIPKKYLNILPFRPLLNNFFYSKIKFEKSKSLINLSKFNYKKIYRFYATDNKKLYNKKKINYL